MNAKSGWLTLILITAVQLALLLIAVVFLFSWFGNRTQETLANQACTSNRVIGSQIAADITNLNVSDIRSAKTSEIDQLRSVLATVQMPNYGFVSIVDPKTGTSVCSSPEFPELMRAGTFAGTNFEKNTTDDSDSMLLGVANQAGQQQSRSGQIKFNDRQHYAAATYLPNIDGILIVAQQPSPAVAAVGDKIKMAKQLFFAATLLLGLVCLAATLMVLNRITDRVESQNADMEKEIIERGIRISQTQNAVIFGLAKLAESRDNDTGEHLDRIRSYVLLLAKDLQAKMPKLQEKDFVHNLALASSLHDVGKVGIPDSILLKPGRLTKAEREVMELHTLIGGECLEAIQSRLGENNPFMSLATQIAFYHHERWDGQGYPHGLAKEKIPLAARIVAVADVYDALTSKRPYKDPLSHLESKGIILSGSGSQFDPEVVAAFLRHEDQFESISRGQQMLSDDDVRSDFHTLCERAQVLANQEFESVSVESI
jgi:response regulator RpfG family c-di-GMP phosphodiesterase